MICSARPSSPPPESNPLPPHAGSNDGTPHRQNHYGATFWLSFLANMLLVVAIAMLFRYADFVTLLGGDELQLGWIVGIGMLGSLVIRLVLGVCIDRYGTRLIWLGALVVFVLSCFGNLWVTSCHGPAIYLLRIAFCSSIAGVLIASITFISARVPTVRIAEMIGMLGIAAFLGITLGTQLADFLLGTDTIQRQQVERMFLVAGMLGGCSMLFAWLATRGQVRPVRRRQPPLVALVRRYHPGSVLLVTVVAGAAIGLPGTFLRTFTADLDIPRISLFFSTYSLTVIALRICTRRLPERLGLEPMILLGLAILAVSQLLFLLVRVEWQLLVPAVGYGIAHGIWMPAAIAATIRAFPGRYRGLGTSLVLGMSDLGLLIGAPAAGMIVHYSGRVGLPGYPTMFVTVAGLLGLVGVFYACTCRRDISRTRRTLRKQRLKAPPHQSPDARPAAALGQATDD